MSHVVLSSFVVRFVARSACCYKYELGGDLLRSDALHATRSAFPVSGNATRPRLYPMHATRHTPMYHTSLPQLHYRMHAPFSTPLALGDTFDNFVTFTDTFVTSFLNASIASYAHITSDLYLSCSSLFSLSSELALQAGLRPIGEKCPCIGWVYDWSSCRLRSQIWLSVRLVGIPTGVLALLAVSVHNQNLWVTMQLVGQYYTHIDSKKACPAPSFHLAKTAADSISKTYPAKKCAYLYRSTWLRLLPIAHTKHFLQKKVGQVFASRVPGLAARDHCNQYSTKKVQVSIRCWECKHGLPTRTQNILFKKVSVGGRVGFVNMVLPGAHKTYSAKKLQVLPLHIYVRQASFLVVAGVRECWILALSGAASKPHRSKYILFVFLFSSYIFSPGCFWLFFCSSGFSSWLSGLFCAL